MRLPDRIIGRRFLLAIENRGQTVVEYLLLLCACLAVLVMLGAQFAPNVAGLFFTVVGGIVGK